MNRSEITIRRATVGDVPVMVGLVNNFAEHGVMIHRSHAEMYEQLRDFVVAERQGDRSDQGDVIVGVVGLRVMWSTLSEVYALAVAKSAQGMGVGRMLVEAAVADAESLGVHKVFALTYERAFFERLEFAVVDRQELPLKVWGECVRCPKHDACDEIAVVRVLREPTPAQRASEQRLRDQGLEAGYDEGWLPQPINAVLRIDREASENR